MRKILLFLFLVVLSTTGFTAMIDGPANIFSSPRGKKIGVLKNGVEVTVVKNLGFWKLIRIKIPLKSKNIIKSLKNPKGRVSLADKGYINARGAKFKVKSKFLYIYAYTAKPNFKSRILYFRNFSKKIINKTHVKIKLSSPISERVCQRLFKQLGGGEYVNENKGNLPRINRKYAFVQVAYYKGKPSLLKAYKFVSEPGGTGRKKIQIVEKLVVGENGKLRLRIKNYGVDTEMYTYRYYNKNAFCVSRRAFNIFAPAAYHFDKTYFIEAQGKRYKFAYLITQNKIYKTCKIKVKTEKYLGDTLLFSKTYKTKKIQEAYLKLKSDSIFQKMMARVKPKINFYKEYLKLKKSLVCK